MLEAKVEEQQKHLDEAEERLAHYETSVATSADRQRQGLHPVLRSTLDKQDDWTRTNVNVVTQGDEVSYEVHLYLNFRVGLKV